MTKADDNIEWFHQHCSSTYNWLETAMPMVDIATFTIKHIKILCLSHVSKKVKSDFFKILLDFSKANGNLVVFFIEPITLRLLNLIEDDEFSVDNFVMYHLSMPIVVSEQSSLLANLLEQGTPLTNNLSEHARKVLSRQLQRIHVEHSEIIPRQTSVDEEGAHKELATAVTNSSKIAPVNLEMSFAAEQWEERLDCPASPFGSNEDFTRPHPRITRLRSQ
jgi:hypothetical protein